MSPEQDHFILLSFSLGSFFVQSPVVTSHSQFFYEHTLNSRMFKTLDGSKAVVVTCDSMKQPQWIGTKLPIMSAGRFRTIGSASEFKDRFGKGFEFALRFKQLSEASIAAQINAWNLADITRVEATVCAKICDAVSADRRELYNTQVSDGENGQLVPVRAFVEWWIQTDLLKKL